MNHSPILVSAFEPFGTDSINASWEAVCLLPDTIAGHRVERMLLPVEFGRSGDLIVEAMRTQQPAAVVAVGQAAGRAHLTVERVAVNLERARTADNAGACPNAEAVVPGAPPAYFATLPVDSCVEAARAAGVPTDASETAGLYVCNQLMYRILHELATAGSTIAAGFVHVPQLPIQVLDRPGVPFISAALSASGVEAVLNACLC